MLLLIWQWYHSNTILCSCLSACCVRLLCHASCNDIFRLIIRVIARWIYSDVICQALVFITLLDRACSFVIPLQVLFKLVFVRIKNYALPTDIIWLFCTRSNHIIDELRLKSLVLHEILLFKEDAAANAYHVFYLLVQLIDFGFHDVILFISSRRAKHKMINLFLRLATINSTRVSLFLEFV